MTDFQFGHYWVIFDFEHWMKWTLNVYSWKSEISFTDYYGRFMILDSSGPFLINLDTGGQFYLFWRLMAHFWLWTLVAGLWFWTPVTDFWFRTLVAEFWFETPVVYFWFLTLVGDFLFPRHKCWGGAWNRVESYEIRSKRPKSNGSYYITGDEWGMRKRPKYEWSAGKQI